MEESYLQVYTGNGKGKSTAAFGLAIRVLCAGEDVYVGQFVKSMKYNETRIGDVFDGSNPGFGRIVIEQLGRGCFIRRNPEQADIDKAREGLRRCWEMMHSGLFRLVVMDELNIALHFGLLEMNEVRGMLEDRPREVEVVVTGRYAPQELLDMADLVTEMKEVKHYYTQGVLSRNGIDR